MITCSKNQLSYMKKPEELKGKKKKMSTDKNVQFGHMNNISYFMLSGSDHQKPHFLLTFVVWFRYVIPKGLVYYFFSRSLHPCGWVNPTVLRGCFFIWAKCIIPSRGVLLKYINPTSRDRYKSEPKFGSPFLKKILIFPNFFHILF